MKTTFFLLLACIAFSLFSPLASADDFILIINKALGTGTEVSISEVPRIVSDANAVGKVSFIFFLAVRFILYVVGIGAVIMIVYAGFRLTTSMGGDALETSKKTITYAIFGLLAVILSLMVIETVVRILV
jgi:hypothetical protein